MITIDPIKRPSKVSSSVNTEEIMKEVDLRIADALDGSIEIPLEYVTKSELEAKGYLTSHQDISHLATQSLLSSIDTELSELGQKVDGIEDGSSFLNYEGRFEWTNQWIGGDGNGAQINIYARCYFYPVVKGDKITLSLSSIGGSRSKNYYHYAFYSKENPSSESLMTDYSFLRKPNVPLNTVVEVPEGALLIGITVSTDAVNKISFAKIGEKIESLVPLQRNMEDVSDIITKPISINRSVFGVLGNGQGITEEEAKGAFLGFYSPTDLKTYNIRTDGNDKYILQIFIR